MTNKRRGHLYISRTKLFFRINTPLGTLFNMAKIGGNSQIKKEGKKENRKEQKDASTKAYFYAKINRFLF